MQQDSPKEVTPSGEKKKGKRSFLRSFGTFLMMGGWILLVIVILGIVIAVSLMTKP